MLPGVAGPRIMTSALENYINRILWWRLLALAGAWRGPRPPWRGRCSGGWGRDRRAVGTPGHRVALVQGLRIRDRRIPRPGLEPAAASTSPRRLLILTFKTWGYSELSPVSVNQLLIHHYYFPRAVRSGLLIK